MAVGGKPPSKIFVKSFFSLLLSITVPAYYLGNVKKSYANAIFIKKKYSTLKFQNGQNDHTGHSS